MAGAPGEGAADGPGTPVGAGPVSGRWAEWARSRNAKTLARSRWRRLSALDGSTLRGRTAEGKSVVVFASNDYLGLSLHPRVVAAAKEAAARWGTGAGAARLMTGTRPVHSELEAALAAWKGEERALVYPSGYAANIGVLSALGGPGVLICSDALNHASIVDGCRLAGAVGATVRVYPHRRTEAVEEALAGWPGRAVVVSDSVFSMDGDTAAVRELADLCAATGALLVLDEAHAVLGPLVQDLPCELLRTGTLSKALGSQGGFAAGPAEMVDLLVNRSRSFIFTTALAPASAAAALEALRLVRSPEGGLLLEALMGHARRLWPGRAEPTPILPVPCGTEDAALRAAAELLERGFAVPAVRPPTVAPGTSRLRVTVSSGHTPAEVAALAAALEEIGLAPGSYEAGT